MAVALAASSGNTEDFNGAGGDIVLTAPTSIAAGDLRIHFAWQVAGGSAPDIGTGYINIGSNYNATDSNGIRAVYRVAGASEGNGTHTTPGADTTSWGYPLRVTGAHVATPINASAVNHTASGTSPRTLPTVTTTVDNCLIVYLALIGSQASTPVMADVGTVFDTALSGPPDLVAIYSEVQTSAGTTTARDVTWTGGGSVSVAYAVIAIAPDAPIDNPYVVGAAKTSALSTNDPSLTFDDPPLENDVVIMWPSSTTALSITSEPSGWVNVLGATVSVNSDAHGIVCVYHVVTAAEETAATVTFTATDLLAAAETGNTVGCVVRNVDPADILGGANSTFGSANTVTPHVLALVTPDVTGGLVLSAVAKDGTGTYTEPAGWTELVQFNTNQGKWLGSFDTFTTASSQVGPTNITPSAGDEYASITVVMNPPSGTDATATPAVVAATVAVPAPTVATGAAHSAAVVAAVVSVPAPTVSTATDATATPAAVATVVAVPAPTVGAGAGTTPAAVAAVVAVPAATVSAGGGAEVTATAVTAVVAVPAPTVSTATNATATPAAVALTVAVTAPLIALGEFPTSISADNRTILDQHGDPWPALADANIVIHTVPHATADEVATGKSVESYLDELVAHGFNSFWCKFIQKAGDLLYADVDSNLPYTGTIFQSSLNDPFWDNWEIVFGLAAARGITIFVFPTWAGFDDTEGERVEMEAASGAQMESYGAALGARFKPYPNVIWMNTGDRPVPTATLVSRWASIQTGIIGAGATQLWGMQGTRNVLHSTYISDNGMGAQTLDLNTMYQDETDPTADGAAGWAENIGPVIAYEMRYENENAITFDELRLQYWGFLCTGGVGHVFGNKPRWHMDTLGPPWDVSGVTYLETWDDTDGDDDRGTKDFVVFITFIASLNGSYSGMVPDTTDTFLTAGEGTGVTRASARFDGDATSGVMAVAYRPHGGAATLTFDVAEFTAVSSVRIRKLDPVSGAYTTLGTFATTGTQNVGSLGNNSSGNSDWVIVFEQSGDVTATPAAVALTVAVAAPTVATGAATAAGTVAATVAVLAATVTTGAAATPSTVAATVTVPAPSITAGADVNAAPNAVVAVAAVPAPTVTTGAAHTTAAVAVAVAVPAPTVTTSTDITPTAVAAVVAVHAPTVTANTTAIAVTVAAVVTVPAPSIVAGGTAAVTPGAVALTVAVHAPTVTASSGATPAAITVLAGVPAPTISTGVTVVAAVVALTVAVHTAAAIIRPIGGVGSVTIGARHTGTVTITSHGTGTGATT